MAEPPKTPPHSDIEGVNRDARAGRKPDAPHPDPGGVLHGAKKHSTARPEQTPPSE